MQRIEGTDGVTGQDGLLATLRRRASLIALTCVAVAASAYLISSAQEPKYESAALLVLQDPRIDPREVFGPPTARDPKQDSATNALLVGSRPVIERTARRLDVAPSQFQIQVERRGETDAVAVRATASDAVLAARVANTFSREFITYQRETERRRLQSAISSLERARSQAPPDRRALYKERADQLRVLGRVVGDSAEIVEDALPATAPESPKPLRDTLLGGLFGLLLGGALALLREQSDRRVRHVSQLEDAFGQPLLGTIPKSGALADKGRPQRLPPGDAEAFRLVQANTRFFNTDRDVRSVIVTSAASGEGKTTLAWNLAAAAASGGVRVLLVEADLRNPSMSKRYGLLRHSAGLSGVLTGEAELDEAVQAVPVIWGRNGEGPDLWMDVVTAGAAPANPTDLIASERMRETIRRAEQEYSFVLIDTPPVAGISDAIPLLREVGGVIVVSYLGRSTRGRVERLLAQLRNLDVTILGIVANGASRGEYDYPYGDRTRV